MKAHNKIVIQFSSLPENVAFARVAVAAFASQVEFSIDDLEEIKVALSEAVTNAIVHGYQNDPSEMVAVRAEINGDDLIMFIEDEGRGITDIDQALKPTFSSDPERMGLGFAFMQSFSDRFSVESTPGKGTKVTMTRSCSRNASARQSH